MTRLESLCDAIRIYEGWWPLSRSWRNNNPGNLRYSVFQSGTKNGFAQFDSYASGWLGLWYDLWLKCTIHGPLNLGPNATLQDLFNVWAPFSDGNNPVAYAAFVAARIKMPVTTLLSWFTQEFSNQ